MLINIYQIILYNTNNTILKKIIQWFLWSIDTHSKNPHK